MLTTNRCPQDAWVFQDYSSEDLFHIMRDAAKRKFDWCVYWPVKSKKG